MKLALFLSLLCLFPARKGAASQPDAVLLPPAGGRLAAIFPDDVEDYIARDPDGRKLEIPYVPTPMAAVVAILEMARVGEDDIVFDLGCGDGRIPIAAADYYGARGVGVDLDPRRIEESLQNAAAAGVEDRVEFRVADVFDTDFSRATVVTLYLLQAVNLELRPLLLERLRPGTRVVSHMFDMGDWEPDHSLVVSTGEIEEHPLYLWLIPAPFDGSWSGEIEAGPDRLPLELELEREFQLLAGGIRLDGPAAPITKGRLYGKSVALEAEAVVESGKTGLRLLGRIEGDRAEGLALIEKGRWAGAHPWTAARSR